MAPRLNIPPLTRSLFVSLIALTFLNATIQPGFSLLSPFVPTDRGSPYLTIVPGISWTYPWTFVTATLVEQNVFGLAVTGLTLFFGGRYLERAYGSSEYAKYMLVTALIPNFFCFAFYIFLNEAFGSGKAFTTTISGAIATQASFLVSFKQLVPEHTVSVARGLIRMRVKHFPAIFLLANTASAVIFGTETPAFLAWLGFLVSWTYLRFYRRSASLSASTATGGEASTVTGDASDTFAFAYFFPEATHPFLNPATAAVYNVLVALRLCTPFSSEAVDASNETASARAEGAGLPTIMGGRGSGRREEAERRRALALAALDQRLNAAVSRPLNSAPAGPSGSAPTPPAVQQDQAGADVQHVEAQAS